MFPGRWDPAPEVGVVVELAHGLLPDPCQSTSEDRRSEFDEDGVANEVCAHIDEVHCVEAGGPVELAGPPASTQ